MKFLNVVLVALLCLVGVNLSAQEKHFTFHFRDGSPKLDMSYRDNQAVADSLAAVLKAGTTEGIKYFIEGKTSPSGSREFNRRLSVRRAGAIIEYLRSKVEIPDSMLTVCADGIDWESLVKFVEEDNNLKYKDKVIDILKNVPVWTTDSMGRAIDSRKKRLMELDYGRIYRTLDKRYFAKLRRTDFVLRRPRVEEVDTILVIKVDTTPTIPSLQTDLADADDVRLTPFVSEKEYEPLHRMALKSNLIYDALLMPSLEVEYRFDNNWSVMLEGDMAWWKNTHKNKYYQVATISPEARYWFKTRKPWHGHFLGVFGGFTWYDWENGGRGYKGEAQMAGLTYGYMFPINKVLSFEASIGLGYLHTKNHEYLPIDGHFVYQLTNRINYFGPVKLKFSLVWRIWDMNKKGGKR